jgi:hypothetical protein
MGVFRVPMLILLGIIVGLLLIGERIVPCIELFYSSLRVLQIDGLLDPRLRASSQMPKPLWLVLGAAMVLWALNAIALAIHLLWMAWRLLQPG